MNNTIEEDYNDRFTYKLEATLDYSYPFDETPKKGKVYVIQEDELGEFNWKVQFSWDEFWPSVVDRISYNPSWQSGFDQWVSNQPQMGFESNCGDIIVKIYIYLQYHDKFEGEVDIAEICITLLISKQTGVLCEWYI